MDCNFNDYITKYSLDLTRLCLSLCGNRADADDLFQDTWYKAMKNYSKYNRALPFDKWLFAICVNTYKNNVKLAFNRRNVSFANDEEKMRFMNSIPDITEKNSDDYIMLHTAIQKLDKKRRIVLVLFYFKDYSIKEISEILKIPEGTVKSRLYSAKSELKRSMSYE